MIERRYMRVRKLRIKKFKDNHRQVWVCKFTGMLCEPTNTCHDCPKVKGERK